MALLAQGPDEVWPRRQVPVRSPTDGALQPVVVLDGDTFVLVDGRRVRLAGVDTPEVGRPLAAAATEFAARHLHSRRLTLHPAAPSSDHYGRLLADVQADGESLSEALVSAGLAWTYRTDSPSLGLAQQQAVEARRGIHGWPSTGPWAVTGQSFHDPSCSVVRARLRELPLAVSAGELFAAGRSPCRQCLAWPPPRTSP